MLTSISTPLFDGTVSTEVSDDYTLPDYYPEIRRVVSVTAHALPESKFISDGKIEFGGTVAFAVIYVGDTGELASVPYAFAYADSTALPKQGIAESVTVTTTADQPSCRVSSPRKISLRARLRSHVLALESTDTTAKIADASGRASAEDLLAIERKTAKLTSLHRIVCTSSGEASGIIRTDGEATLVSCDGNAVITQAVVSDGKITLVGEAEASALCVIDGRYVTVRAKSPISETIPADVKSGMPVTAYAVCASSSVQSDGDKSVLHYEIEYDVTAEAASPYETEATEDAYSSSCEATLRMAEADALSPFCFGITSVSVDGAGESPDGDVIARSADASVDRVDIVGDKLVVTGAVAVRSIVGDDFTKVDTSIPFRAEMHGTNVGGRPIGNVRASVSSLSVRSGGGRIAVTAEVAVSAAVMADVPVRYVAEAELDKAKRRPKDAERITVYYTTDGESPWDVAKRYAVPMSEVERNGDGNVYVI